jgi:hypothetical protein
MANDDRPAQKWPAGRVTGFFEPIDPPLYSRRHFIPCKSYPPPMRFVPIPLSDVPYR